MTDNEEQVAALVVALQASCRAVGVTPTVDGLVKEGMAARLLAVSAKTLRNDRASDQRFPFVKRGRSVFYRLESIARWMIENGVEG